MKTKLLVAVILLVVSGQVFPQAQFNTDVKRVAIFKNGYAFTYREGVAQLQNGWAYTTNVPIGALGTVWGYSLGANTKVSELLASNSDKTLSKRVENLAEYLLINEGERARFTLNYGNKVVEGTYQIVMGGGDFSTEAKIAADPEAYKRLDLNRLSVVVKADTGAIFVPAQMISTVEIVGPVKIDRPTTIKENRVALKVAGASNESLALGIAALERGIQWIPSYRVEVKGTPVNEAKIELEAVLVNDLTDLKDTEVYFVVGVPHFLFQNDVSPLSLNQAFTGVSNNVRNFSQMMSNSIMTTLDGADAGAPANRARTATIDDEEQAETTTAEQLFLYKADSLTVRKGERASMRLFSLTVPCTEVFEWTINDSPRAAVYSTSDGQPVRFQEFTNQFWYGLKLTNKTDMPWTTAPAISFREWRPMGQDMLTFTPVNGENVLRVSPATELIGTHRIEEKSRISEVRKINGASVTYDAVTLEGTIHIKNVKARTVNVTLTRNLVGKVIAASDGGVVAREGQNLLADNSQSVIKWNISMPSGEKDVTYTYRVYVRK